ncbi:MAG TPA: hypothetical protein ENK51_08080 [Gammaproteobacteria bacterium]|nr:hypothetical protein [Gammaproteobacteria bacterium]
MRVFFTTLILLGLSFLLLVACSSPPPSTSRSASYVVDGSEDTGTSWRRSTPSQVMLEVEPLASDGIHDPESEALPVLQEPAEALAAFPIDRRGAADWVKALDLGIISPRADLLGESEMAVLDMDIMFKDTGAMPWVLFPHDKHTAWLDCTNCHDEIFIPQAGANKITMDAVLAGEFCGRCHGKVSFTLWVCERCHSVPHEGSPAKWW